ncbi:AAA family ATPase [Enterococcus faecalis]|uniref:ParA family protein n=1 Tax=Enterococcus faecalis TaxID=1351 RepID=UPI001143B094|nr:AAA family ATPase [Enterococcus faecalis]NSW26106.1 AAA family ATPase [Enterococcus faecalis]TQB47567.1 AAA family ATPase [Enterococcus faecalis]
MKKNRSNSAEIISLVKQVKDLVAEKGGPIVISVANQKGGVGKSATVDNLAELFASFDLITDIVDIDAQSSITNLKTDLRNIIDENLPEMTQVMLEEETLENITYQIKNNLFISPTTLRLSDAELNLVNATLRELILKKNIESLETKFDIILIDCPPSRGLLTVNALSASDYILIPVQSEYQALVSIELLFSTINKVKNSINPNLKELGYVVTMATNTNHSDEIIEEVKSDDKAEVISIIDRSIVVSDAGVANMSSYEFDSNNKAGIAYYNLAVTVLQKIVSEGVV